MDLSDRQLELVRSSFAKVFLRNFDIGSRFYERLFVAAPSVKSLFREEQNFQAKKFVDMLSALMTLVRNQEKLELMVRMLGERHGALYLAQPAHYAVVGTVLIDVLAEGLGSDFDYETRVAWKKLYDSISQQMIASQHIKS